MLRATGGTEIVLMVPLPMRIHNMPQNDKKIPQPLTNAEIFSIFLCICDAISSLRNGVLRRLKPPMEALMVNILHRFVGIALR
jgi:hypothetical protein